MWLVVLTCCMYAELVYLVTDAIFVESIGGQRRYKVILDLSLLRVIYVILLKGIFWPGITFVCP